MPGARSPATAPNDLFTREKPLQGPPHSSAFHGEPPKPEPRQENEAVTLGRQRGGAWCSRKAGRGERSSIRSAHRALLEGRARSLGRWGLGEAQKWASGSPCHLETVLCFSLPSVWVAKSDSPWGSFSPHLPFPFNNLFFFFL